MVYKCIFFIILKTNKYEVIFNLFQNKSISRSLAGQSWEVNLQLKSFTHSLSFHFEDCRKNSNCLMCESFFGVACHSPMQSAGGPWLRLPFPFPDCIMLSFSLTAGTQNSPLLNYWHVSNSLTTCCFLKEKYPPNPIKCTFALIWTTFPSPYFSDRWSHLFNDLWHEH